MAEMIETKTVEVPVELLEQVRDALPEGELRLKVEALLPKSESAAPVQPEEVKKEETKMETKLVNLTPLALNIYDANGENLLLTLEPTAPAARCPTKSETAGTVNGIPLFTTTYGEVADLPEPQEGTMYVVSLVVRSVMPTRKDLASPGELIRDDKGQPKGCKGLAVNS